MPRVLAKNSFTENGATQFLSRFDQSDRLISRFGSTFYDQYSSDDILPQEYLMIVSSPCDMCKNPSRTLFSK